jgi:CheY-like chemotaxis protein
MMIPKILIVEDSPLLRKILREAIREAGYIPYEAENGRSGLMSAKEIKPDMILLDVLMPVMDGMTMYEHLLAEDWGKSFPVVMLTSSTDEEIQDWITSKQLEAIKKDDTMVEAVIEKMTAMFGS